MANQTPLQGGFTPGIVVLVPARMRKLNALYRGIEKETRRLIDKLPEDDHGAVFRFFNLMNSAQEASDGDLNRIKREGVAS